MDALHIAQRAEVKILAPELHSLGRWKIGSTSACVAQFPNDFGTGGFIFIYLFIYYFGLDALLLP